jgi:hypothetical protein
MNEDSYDQKNHSNSLESQSSDDLWSSSERQASLTDRTRILDVIEQKVNTEDSQTRISDNEESKHSHKKKIWKDKVSSLEINTQIKKLYKIMDRIIIRKDRRSFQKRRKY